jgi:hypothetical protein
MDAIVVRTEHWPAGALPTMKDYWLASANGVQSDGETEQQAIYNAQAAFERGDPVDPAYRP